MIQLQEFVLLWDSCTKSTLEDAVDATCGSNEYVSVTHQFFYSDYNVEPTVMGEKSLECGKWWNLKASFLVKRIFV